MKPSTITTMRPEVSFSPRNKTASTNPDRQRELDREYGGERQQRQRRRPAILSAEMHRRCATDASDALAAHVRRSDGLSAHSDNRMTSAPKQRSVRISNIRQRPRAGGSRSPSARRTATSRSSTGRPDDVLRWHARSLPAFAGGCGTAIPCPAGFPGGPCRRRGALRRPHRRARSSESARAAP